MSSAELRSVAIFPLPRVHLFPHALLPLHIFEPRYRQMIKDCLAPDGSRQLVIAPVDERREPTDRGPAVHRVCGLGVIVEHTLLADGRWNILLRGIGRVRVVDELPRTTLYRTVRAESLFDHVPDEFDARGATETLLVLVDQLARKLPSGGETLRELARAHPSASALSDVLASAIVTDADSRQELMETLNVAARADQMSGLLAALLRRLNGAAGAAGN